jgi:hypothetical protein
LNKDGLSSGRRIVFSVKSVHGSNLDSVIASIRRRFNVESILIKKSIKTRQDDDSFKQKKLFSSSSLKNNNPSSPRTINKGAKI